MECRFKLGFKPQLENEKVAAAIVHNAGLYNGFIAVGLVFCAFPGHGGFHARLFFLSCAIVAGIFGAVTLTPKTLLIQTLPAFLPARQGPPSVQQGAVRSNRADTALNVLEALSVTCPDRLASSH